MRLFFIPFFIGVDATLGFAMAVSRDLPGVVIALIGVLSGVILYSLEPTP